MNIKPLVIDHLIARLPIIQGGMGVGVSLSNLAGAVAAEGGIGVISSAQIGYTDSGFESNPLKANLAALARHIKLARTKAKEGVIGVNIMVALKHYEEYVRCCVENKVDLIISGAGLPVNLPALVKNSATKIAPIISSVKAASVLFKMWDKRYGTTADILVIEGPQAGGHLGFRPEALEKFEKPVAYDQEVRDILHFTKTYEEKYQKRIPVIFAGGVFHQNDFMHYMEMGCDGVQVASQFVVTEECDVHENFKRAYIEANQNDIAIVESPVGMPGRAIINDLIRRTALRNDDIPKCYSCLTHCDIKTIPYCITKSLVASAKGDVQNGLIFCGAKTYQLNEITTVKKVLQKLTE